MKKTNPDTKRVIVAMSGGIDSSAAAALLKKAGFDVVGIFMKFWSERDKNGLICVQNRCCTPESEKRARLVAEKLNIPFYVFDFQKEFKKKVVDYFLKNYKIGLTPNPCIVCNKEIKFGLLFKKFPIQKDDFFATGHYTRLRREFPISNFQFPNYKLLKGKDKNKDQSYFLWKLNQKILKKALFPIGDYTKTEVRKLAQKFNLPVLDVPESQEICFIQTTIADFLKRHLKVKPGKIVDAEGNLIGQHQGLWFYTIGQRRGIGLPGWPYYVLDKDMKKNLLVVTKHEKDLYKKELIAKNINWISGRAPGFPIKVKAKIRYRHPAFSATLKDANHLVFVRPQRAITPGQSVVFYKGQELLGGGIICRS